MASVDSGLGFFLWPLFLLVLVIEWLWNALVALAPLLGIAIGVLCVIAAILSGLVLFIPARKMARAKRTWVRIIGWVLIALEAIATLAFVGVAVIAFAAVAIYA